MNRTHIPKKRVLCLHRIALCLILILSATADGEAQNNSPTVDETAEKRAFGAAKKSFSERTNRDDFSALTNVISQYPSARRTVPTLLELANSYYQAGYFSKALETWKQAWETGRSSEDPLLRPYVDNALGQLARMYARLGRFEDLEALFAETGDRSLSGSATEMIVGARSGAWAMRNKPEDAFRCGPMALGRLLAMEQGKKGTDPRVIDFKSTQHGTSLYQVWAESQKLGADYQIAKRSPGAEILTPAVAHWNVGHFAALSGKHGEGYLLQDPTFGEDIVITQQALDSEASGYFLVRAGPLPSGWTAVAREEGEQIWGKGQTAGSDDKKTKPEDTKCPDGKCPKGMADYSVHAMLISLNIEDTPFTYVPAFGPEAMPTIVYNQRDAYQPAVFRYTHFGPKWTCTAISFVQDDPEFTPYASVANVYERGGGVVSYTFSGTTTGGNISSAVDKQDGSVLLQKSDDSYERFFPDGSKYIYAQSDGATEEPRRIFLTQVIDPQGNAVVISYDTIHVDELTGEQVDSWEDGAVSALRISTITDATGKETTFYYNGASPNDPLQPEAIGDPFGRVAYFAYHENGRLKRITDPIGVFSEFAYSGDFVNSLTTPYGVTRFEYGDNTNGEFGYRRWIEIIDPLGGKERTEYRDQAPRMTYSTDDNISVSILQYTGSLDARNTFYWSKKAMQEGAGDYSKAEIIHWLHLGGDLSKNSGIIESRKKPLESRVWYNYQGQSEPHFEGDTAWPTKIARLLDDGTTQLYQYEYNSIGKVTKAIDPVGRETVYEYAGNGVDLLRIKQKNGSTYDTIVEYSGYNSQHLPSTKTDAAGETTTYTYTANGSIATITNAKSETTTYTYETNSSADGYGELLEVEGAISGATTTVTYEDGNVATLTDSEGYIVEISYDAFDRPLTYTYPDGTYVQHVYDRLDVKWMRDRMGRWTHMFSDALRRTAAVVDPAGRTTMFDWCTCGALHSFTDANGNKTAFKYDVQSRMIEKKYADDSVIALAYENTTSRLKTRTDAMGQKKNYTYFKDNALKQVSFTDALHATPSYEVAYDENYRRPTLIIDGTGTSSLSYVSTGTLGALKIESIEGPLASLSYSYDELGRRTGYFIDGAGESASYDALGRVISGSNALGIYTNTYINETGRLATVSCANGLVTHFDYFDNEGDQRLKEIKHIVSGTSEISKFQYEYDDGGSITSWRQHSGPNDPVEYELGYDPVDQLVEAVLKNATTGTPIDRQGFRYDRLGNRTSEWKDDTVTGATFNELNQLITREAGGTIEISGTMSEPGTVTVGGTLAPTNGANRFSGAATVRVGTNSVPIVATDASGNSTSKNALIVVPGDSSKTMTYDANGNMLSDGDKTYAWDAENRLIKITYADSSWTEFAYDGFGRRVKIVEKNSSGMETSIKNHIWDGLKIGEERDSSNAVVKKFYEEGMVHDDAAYFYTKDHLGSVRELTNENGVVETSYNYDLYGRQESSLPFGMKLWLKADAGVTKDGSNKVSAWADQSGSGANANQATSGAQPTWVDSALNGKPVLRFDGSDDFLQGTNNGYNPSAGDYTIFVVHKRTSSAYWTGAFTYNAASGVYGAPIAGWRENTEQFGVNFVGSSDAGVYVNHSGSPNDFYLTTVQRKGGTNGNGGGLKVRSVSEGLLLESSGTQSWSSGASANYSVGRHWWNNGGHQLNGDVAEVIVYNRNLSPSERSRVEVYLGKKYSRNVMQSDFRYTGHYFHERSGLSLALYRAYDSELGTWISRDPIGEKGGINLYGYVANNPINLVDPFGLDHLNLLPPGDPAHDYRDSLPLPSDSYSVVGHGIDAYSMLNAQGGFITPQELAALIMNDPRYDPNKPVKLVSCGAADSRSPSGTTFAQKLADYLQNDVLAPTRNISPREEIRDNGVWERKSPQTPMSSPVL